MEAHADHRTSPGRPWWRVGLLAGAAAAIVNLAIAAVASAADVALEANGDEIPLPAFVVATLIGTVLGLVLAEALARWASRPASTWTVAAAVLTVVSLASPLTADADGATVAVLALTHVVAAAIVIPVVARQLPSARTSVASTG